MAVRVLLVMIYPGVDADKNVLNYQRYIIHRDYYTYYEEYTVIGTDMPSSHLDLENLSFEI